jgi:SAM-dependent methyltransferase
MSALQELTESESAQLAHWEQRVESLIRRKGGSASAREFQRILNVLFHDIEAAHYDHLHGEMWESLPPVFERLATDIEHTQLDGSDWRLADVGCGTGLATELLLRTTLSTRISALQMVDTSTEMLNRCRERAERWRLPTDYLRGQIDLIPEASADILIACSVLHHIPELLGFCRQVQRVLKPGGLFIHVHDPRSAAVDSEIVKGRAAQLAEIRKRKQSRISRLPGRILHALAVRAKSLLRRGYLDDVNRRLIDADLIKKPLTSPEIWSITDLRVGDLPYSATDGISRDELAVALADFECISIRTYGFFGVLASNLPTTLAAEERRLFAECSGDGVFLAGAWLRRDINSGAPQ